MVWKVVRQFNSFHLIFAPECIRCNASLMIGTYLSAHFKLEYALSKASLCCSFLSNPCSLTNFAIRSTCSAVIKWGAIALKIDILECILNLEISVQNEENSKCLLFGSDLFNRTWSIRLTRHRVFYTAVGWNLSRNQDSLSESMSMWWQLFCTPLGFHRKESTQSISENE